MFTALLLVSGAFWVVTYSLIIRQGFRDRTYGMPFIALCANLSWEFLFSFVYPHGYPQRAVNFIWLSFDLVIAWQVLTYGPREWDIPQTWFTALFGASLLMACGGVMAITVQLENMSGSYAAFGQNLMMSALFISMLLRRGTLAGQSLGIAVCKLFGTLAASLAFFLLTEEGSQSILLVYLYVSIFVLDVIYVGMILRNRQMPPVTLRTDSSESTTPATGS